MIEIATFRLAADADVDAFLAADRAHQIGVAYKQPGIIRRTTARADDGTWAVITLWASPEHADAAPPFDPPGVESTEVTRYTELD